MAALREVAAQQAGAPLRSLTKRHTSWLSCAKMGCGRVLQATWGETPGERPQPRSSMQAHMRLGLSLRPYGSLASAMTYRSVSDETLS